MFVPLFFPAAARGGDDRDNPNNALAISGLKRVSKLMVGLDPSDEDAPGDDGEADDLVLDDN